MVITSPELALASNDSSSSSFSITVYRRRAPMFSVRSLTENASSASRRMPSSVNSSFTSSVPSRAVYCLISEASVSDRMLTKSSALSESSSTRMGKRPCNSGMRSEGRARWKAPEAMNRIWSVRTMP
ncbi:Uncharacterised protein [Bordetella pertussis]|nr:Uncharacterised protein [Bordetella pertussis]CFO72571.1 Uncharacterised protein [Bordetella pertussis]CFU83072.1 Uncharacterised protein [Bordetella pertussis]CPI07540.1 Uncharacterised protein [Bordetella pertussis]CPK66060.1 Uncharacterised protein [Bordetella pertussis]